MDPEARYEALVAEPPSAKLVYKVLELDAPLTHGEITEAAVLPSRTVSYALNRLKEAHVIEASPCPHDPRKQNYRPLPIESPDAEPAPESTDGEAGESPTVAAPQPSD